MIYLRLFYEFFKTGLFAIGGGLATLPFLYDMSSRTGWFTPNDITNMIAISQSTPGPLGINMAAYTGYLTGGILGGIIAPLGLITPSLLIIMGIAKILDRFKGNKWINPIFYGLKPASLALIVVAWISVLKVTYQPLALFSGPHSEGAFFWQGLLLAGFLFFILRIWKVHPIALIVVAGLIGLIIRL